MNSNNLPDKEKLWYWQEELNRVGPRFTGNKAHRKLIDFFEQELTDMGLKVNRDKHLFTKWEAKQWSLSVQAEHGGIEEYPVTSYYPYSGTTTEDGVVGELIYCGLGPGNFKQAAGKIAIVEVTVSKLPSSVALRKRTSFPKSAKLPFGLRNSVVSSLMKGPDLVEAQQAGVLGVICVWKKISAENVRGQYLPFTTALKDCPALWVDGNTGDQLKQLAFRHAKARLVLHAEIEENADSDTLYAILPGTNRSENILINTHTDGPNACEENGGVGLLAMAEYFSKLPLEQRQRDLVFVFVTGHFQIPQFGIQGQATTRWLHDHPELWDGVGGHQKAVAGLTLEHLGCREWKDNQENSQYSDTGNLETELVYTANEMMNTIYLDSLKGRTKVRSITLKPVNNIHFGEGQPLFDAGIPNISLVPAPDYLCATGPNGYLDKLDIDFMDEQIGSFIKMTTVIDRTPVEVLGQPEPYAKGLLGFLVKDANEKQ
ncbi:MULTISPECIES: hypothetical protein [Paenibacillus]|uniref:Peptidase M28 domain-containing protein n=1 Tax=Paenibacillus borealis TaxID=160799 RepID=A0ABX3GYM5_PAEBO|nr:hypothetical protein [Paenibacillus borealis]OMD40648.1 hypothetical protein BSK56_28470 [Paenibacillus borealis]